MIAVSDVGDWWECSCDYVRCTLEKCNSKTNKTLINLISINKQLSHVTKLFVCLKWIIHKWKPLGIKMQNFIINGYFFPDESNSLWNNSFTACILLIQYWTVFPRRDHGSTKKKFSTSRKVILRNCCSPELQPLLVVPSPPLLRLCNSAYK